MKLAIGLFGAIPAAILLCGASSMRASSSEDAVRWRSDWEAARQEAIKERKSLLVVFR